MENIISPEFTKICDGLAGAEGPIFDKDGTFNMVAPHAINAETNGGEILLVNLKEGKTTLRNAPCLEACGGVPAGCQFDKAGNLFVADMKLGILKVAPDNKCTQVGTEDSDGNPIQGCNDCIFDSEGNLWVTAPASAIQVEPYLRSGDEAFGSVYCVTNTGEIRKIDTGYRFSNGIAVQHDDSGKPKKLIVAETKTKSLWAYDITGLGKTENKELWAKLPGDHDGGPDGMDFDAEGNLLVANWNGGHLEVFASDGSLHARIKCPFDKPSNLDFHPNSREVYVTEHDNDGLWKFTWRCEGRKHFCQLP